MEYKICLGAGGSTNATMERKVDKNCAYYSPTTGKTQIGVDSDIMFVPCCTFRSPDELRQAVEEFIKAVEETKTVTPL